MKLHTRIPDRSGIRAVSKADLRLARGRQAGVSAFFFACWHSGSLLPPLLFQEFCYQPGSKPGLVIRRQLPEAIVSMKILVKRKKSGSAPTTESL